MSPRNGRKSIKIPMNKNIKRKLFPGINESGRKGVFRSQEARQTVYGWWNWSFVINFLCKDLVYVLNVVGIKYKGRIRGFTQIYTKVLVRMFEINF